MHSTTAITFGFSVFVSSLSAQGVRPQFAASEKRVLPLTSHRISALAVADLDRDGFIDILAGHPGSKITIYWQDRDGSLHFSASTELSLEGHDAISSFASADLDGDGDLDIITTRETEGGLMAPTMLLQQVGTRRFTVSELEQNRPPGNTGASEAIIFDANGDSKPDIFVAGNRRLLLSQNQATSNRFFINGGGIKFSSRKQHRDVQSPDLSWPVSGDLDGDGDLDVVGVAYGQLRILTNQGKGVFARASSAQLPRVAAPVTTGPSVGDIDGDGDLDIIVPHGQTFHFPIPSPTTQVMINDGAGNFHDESRSRFPFTDRLWDTRLGDIDGDGDLDLVACRNETGPMQDGGTGMPFCAINDGTGHFTDVSCARFLDASAPSTWIHLADLNRDGDLDVIAIEGERIAIRSNDGNGRFTDSLHERIPAREHDVLKAQFVDLDSDQWPDIAEISDVVTLRHNLGHGRYGPPHYLRGPKSEVPTCVATMDVDGDGDLDVIVGMSMWTRVHPAQVRLFLNDEKGLYRDVTATQMPLTSGVASDIVFADVDNDFDLDIVIANGTSHTFFHGRQNCIYTNDGQGNFTDDTWSFLPNAMDQTTDVDVGDWNRDGHTDLLFANVPNPFEQGINYLYINRGTKGAFSDKIVRLGTKSHLNMPSLGIKFADIDSDENQDIVVMNSGPKQQQRSHTIYLNGPNRHPVPATALHSLSSASLAIADFDLDGDSDIMLGGDDGKTGIDRIFINRGKGSLQEETMPRLQAQGVASSSLEVADVDADGDPDVLAVQDGKTSLLINHHRQIETPYLPVLGSSNFEYRITAEPGYMSAPIGSIPIYSTKLLQRALNLQPFGLCFLDFRHGFVGRPAVIEMHRGQYAHRLSIPKDPSLEGITVHCQAVIWHLNPHSFARFTNLISDRVSRY